jgi:hypothetical protein
MSKRGQHQPPHLPVTGFYITVARISWKNFFAVGTLLALPIAPSVPQMLMKIVSCSDFSLILPLFQKSFPCRLGRRHEEMKM